jgi:hypothetical protein
MRKYFVTAFVLAAMLVFATSGLALEKNVAQTTDARDGSDWAAGATCSVTYANTCTGWLWVWSGWSATDIVGSVFESCCSTSPSVLAATNLYVWTGSPSGYGFTGTVSVSDADANGCAAGLLGSAALLPVSGSNINVWNVAAAGDIVLAYQLGNSAFPDPFVVPTDHPAAGPTGPQACGFCYPSNRTIHSFYYGNANTALCPGSTLNDGICDSEWLRWAATFTCTVSIEDNSWSAVKNLYR